MLIDAFSLSIPTTQKVLEEFCNNTPFQIIKDDLYFVAKKIDANSSENNSEGCHELVKLYDEIREKRYNESISVLKNVRR